MGTVHEKLAAAERIAFTILRWVGIFWASLIAEVPFRLIR
jgi:hypothetical protein